MKTSRRLAVAIFTAVALLPIPASVSAEIVRVEFSGIMDFSSIGGSAAQPYAGVFVYDTAIPPFDSDCITAYCYAHYQMNLVSFQMFGTSLSPGLLAVLVQDARTAGVSDFFTLTVNFQPNGIPIPGTSRVMKAMGVNAVVRSTTFSSPAFPLNLDVRQASTAMNDYAELITGQLLTRTVPPAVSNVVFSAQTPGAPTNFQASVAGNTVNMSWSPPVSGGPPTGYTAVARAPGGQLLATVQVGNVTTLSAGAPDGVYVLSVRASNGAGVGPESSSLTVTVPQAVAPPGAPTNLSVSVAGASASFSWSPPASGGPVANYILLAGTTPGFSVPIATAVLGSTPGTSISGIPPATYFIRVMAQNAGGTSGPSNEVTVIVSAPSLPGAPTLNLPVISGNTVSLSWVAGSGTPTSYVLFVATTPGGSAIATVTLIGTSEIFTGVPSGTYYLRLAAVNGAGTGPASNEINLVVP